jgi:hypothetical protein
MAGADIITIYRGEDVTLPFTMDPVVDVTGWTLAFNILLADGTRVTAAGSVTDGASGTMSVALTDAETDTLTAGSYLYDLTRTDAGSERTLARGTLRVLSVARAVS